MTERLHTQASELPTSEVVQQTPDEICFEELSRRHGYVLGLGHDEMPTTFTQRT